MRVLGLVGSPNKSISSAGASGVTGGGGRLGAPAGRFKMLDTSSTSGVTDPKILANPDPLVGGGSTSGLGVLKTPGGVGRGGRGELDTAGGGGLDGVVGRELIFELRFSSGSCIKSMGLWHGDGEGEGECECIEG